MCVCVCVCFYVSRHSYSLTLMVPGKQKIHTGVPAVTVSCMSMVWSYTGTLSCPVSPGTQTLHPTPRGGLIWGEGPCVLLLVRNNHSRPITFTACHALLGTHWTLKREIIKSSFWFFFLLSMTIKSPKWTLTKLFKVAFRCLIPNRLKQIATY